MKCKIWFLWSITFDEPFNKALPLFSSFQVVFMSCFFIYQLNAQDVISCALLALILEYCCCFSQWTSFCIREGDWASFWPVVLYLIFVASAYFLLLKFRSIGLFVDLWHWFLNACYLSVCIFWETWWRVSAILFTYQKITFIWSWCIHNSFRSIF